MRITRSVPAILSLFLLIGGAVGCSDDDHSPLVGVDWVLRSAVIQDQELYPGLASPEVVVRFSASTYDVENGCTTSGGSYEMVENVIVPADQWGQPNICTIVYFEPRHFLDPFVYDIRGTTMTVTGNEMTHIYDARGVR